MKFINIIDEEYNYETVINDLMTVSDINKWYSANVDTNVDEGFFEYLIQIGVMNIKGYKVDSDNKVKVYSLNDLNNLLLQSFNNSWVKNQSNLYQIKNNRNIIFENYIKQVPKVTKTMIIDSNKSDNKKFKITKISGNKLKLIKLK